MTLAQLVSRAYPAPEWATFFEVSNSTGSQSTRRADAISLGVWPSRGNLIVGFEFKEDRRDWLRELKNPAKAEVMAQHCDEWWLVTSPGIALPEELPAPWGLKVASKNRDKLMTVKPCVPYTDRDRAVMRRTFAAAMLRKVSETMVHKSDVDRQIQEVLTRERERGRGGAEHKLTEALRQVESLKTRIREFEQASGVEINQWDSSQRIGAAVKAVLACDHSLNRKLQSALGTVEQCSKALAAAVAATATAEVSQ